MAELIHGRASTYNNHKCRCDACRKAWAEYIREGGYVRRYQEKQREKKLQNEQASDILEAQQNAMDFDASDGYRYQKIMQLGENA